VVHRKDLPKTLGNLLRVLLKRPAGSLAKREAAPAE